MKAKIAKRGVRLAPLESYKGRKLDKKVKSAMKKASFKKYA
jgi:hypothetical protein